MATVAVVAAIGFGIVASWTFSSEVLVPDRSEWSADVTIRAVSPGRIVFSRSDATTRPGLYGLDWDAGHAVVGSVVSADSETVTRELHAVHGHLEPETDAGFDTDVYEGNPREARGLPFRAVSISGELGPMPAWKIGSRTRTWAIVVHGINDSPEAGLRLAPFLRHTGLPALLITYRDDIGAPSSPDGLHQMGLTEWRDLESAAEFALANGAKRLVLIGYSMGGAIIAQFVERSRLAKRVAGLVLDAPALDWQAILSFNAEQMGLPGFSSKPVEWMIGARIDADWNRLDAIDHSEDFRLPILLFHGSEDQVVPISTSEAFAQELPAHVTYYRVPGAGHTQAWNVDPMLYEAHLRSFLAENLPSRKAPKRIEPDRSGRAR